MNITLVADGFQIFLTSSGGNDTVFEEPIFTTTSFDPNITMIDTDPVFGVGLPDDPLVQADGPGPEVVPIMLDGPGPEVVPVVLDGPVLVPDVLEVVPIAVEDVQVQPIVVLSPGSPLTGASGFPSWWSLIKELFPGDDVKHCSRRKNIAPPNGSKCSKKKDKKCFFGNQVCSGAAFPDTCCFCSGPKSNRTWSCKAEACPK
jgi:hypothetical protein